MININSKISQCLIFGDYELYYIRRVDKKVEYTFRNIQSANIVTKLFNTTAEADKLIAIALGEDLPDYDKAYLKLRSGAAGL